MPRLVTALVLLSFLATGCSGRWRLAHDDAEAWTHERPGVAVGAD